jgi:hypothetical protein
MQISEGVEQNNKTTKWAVGQLVTLKRPYVSFAELHPYFVHPGQIWEGLSIFWSKKTNRKHWGRWPPMLEGREGLVPYFPEEWNTALLLEYENDLRGEEACTCLYLPDKATLLVLEVMVTPWKKKYRHRELAQSTSRKIKCQRFAYVKFLASVDGTPAYLYRDISSNWETLEIDERLFQVEG